LRRGYASEDRRQFALQQLGFGLGFDLDCRRPGSTVA
jgi:hypothetical protein